MRKLYLLLTLCALAELFAALEAWRGNYLSMISVHSIAAVTAAVTLADFIGRFALLESQRRSIFPLYFFLCWIIPFGLWGLAAANLYGLLNPRLQPRTETKSIRIPELPFKPLELDSGLAFTNGGLFDVLRHSVDVEKRIKAVTAATRMRNEDAVPLLKLAMKDIVDDVRLLAFSVKDKIENDINNNIREHLRNLEESDHEANPHLHRLLAFAYWELVYLDLVEGDLRVFMLDQVVKHAQICTAAKPDTVVSVLLGRAFLQLGRLDDAQAMLLLALELGARKESVATYMAEVAFLKAEFTDIPRHLSKLPPKLRDARALRGICAKWLAA